MKSVGRAIQRATWTTDGAVGPGGNPFRMLLTLRHQPPFTSPPGASPVESGSSYGSGFSVCSSVSGLFSVVSMVGRYPIWLYSPPMQGGALDHVALWTDERQALADFLCERAGMHVIDKTDTFTLVGADAKKGKLALFDAEGPRERGAL